MQRDEFHKTTDSSHHYNGTLGMFHPLTINSSESDLTDSSSSEKFSETTLSFEEKFKLQEQEFYKSYNPTVGFNTAVVLAGMLALLVVYVIYRTKCRKFIIKQCNALFQTKDEKELLTQEAMKFTFDDVDVEVADEFQEKFENQGSDDASCIQYGSGTNNSYSTGNRTPVPLLCQYSVRDENGQNVYREVPKVTISNEDKRLPVVVMDMKTATADWVQKQYQFLDPGGIILKVKSDTICPPGNEIYPSTSAAMTSHGACSCTNSHPFKQKPVKQFSRASNSTLNLNNSLPVLEIPDISQTNENKQMQTSQSKRQHLFTRKFPSVSSEPKSPNPPPPMHITPIIKIQNYDKSQRKLTSTGTKDSRDSISSSSSDDQLIYQIPEDEWSTPRIPRRSVVSEQGDNLSACIACSLGQFTPLQSPRTRSDGSTRPKIPQKQQSLTIPVIKYASQRSLSRCHTMTETPL